MKFGHFRRSSGQGGALPLLKPSTAAKASGRNGVAIFGLAKEKSAIFGGTGSGSVVPSHAVSPWAGTTPHDHCWRLGLHSSARILLASWVAFFPELLLAPAIIVWAGITASGSPARKNGFGSFSDHTEDSIADAVRAAHFTCCCALVGLELSSLLEVLLACEQAKAAAGAEVSIVFAGTISGEGADRSTLALGGSQSAVPSDASCIWVRNSAMAARDRLPTRSFRRARSSGCAARPPASSPATGAS